MSIALPRYVFFSCLMFGFMHEANLDGGAMWPTAFALKRLTAAEEGSTLVKKSVPGTFSSRTLVPVAKRFGQTRSEKPTWAAARPHEQQF
jgi:hypothetical protein